MKTETIQDPIRRILLPNSIVRSMISQLRTRPPCMSDPECNDCQMAAASLLALENAALAETGEQPIHGTN